MKEIYYNEKQQRILSLYTSDYNARFHLRKIAREARTDTKTISINLKRLENLGVVISEKIGKHKEFMLNLKSPLANYFLIMAEIYKTIEFLRNNFRIKKISEIIKKKAKVIVIFGSYAKGLETKGSDLDILIVNGKINMKIREKIENLYGIKISPIHFSEEEFIQMQKNKEAFFKEVLDAHIILKGFEFFVDSTWKNYYGF